MVRLLGDGVLGVWVDIDESALTEADRWYVEEHFAERITECGYLRARRYRSIEGSPAYMGLLEASSPAALASEGYRKVTSNVNQRSRRMRAAFRRIIRSTHQVHASHGKAKGGVVACTHLSFRGAPERAAFADWAHTRSVAWAIDHPGVLALHALGQAPEVRTEMDRFRATGQQDQWADGVLLIELGRPGDLDASLRTALGSNALTHAGIPAEQASTALYELMFEISADDFSHARERAST